MNALLRLLTDDSPRVLAGVRARLLELGDEAELPLGAAAQGEDATLRVRARALLEEMRVNRVLPALLACSGGDGLEPPLEEGAMAIARSEYPDLDAGRCTGLLDALAGRVAARMEARRSWRARLSLLRDHLFVEEGFRGNVEAYYDPDNSYLNRVLERRLGIPITLSLVYLAVARRLGVPVHPVAMPGHFILRYGGPRSRTFIDPFGGGQALSRDDCVRFLQGSGLGFQEAFLQTASPLEVLLRMVRNLAGIYRARGDGARLSRMGRLAAALEGR
ncbi:MAG: hypothetical protein HY722_00730 [Planctomycetes bacterium]|nr:hypothetical protein [Planctomycetota bacterium]